MDLYKYRFPDFLFRKPKGIRHIDGNRREISRASSLELRRKCQDEIHFGSDDRKGMDIEPANIGEGMFYQFGAFKTGFPQ